MDEGNNRPIKIGKYLYALRLMIKENANTMANCYRMDEKSYIDVEAGKRNLSLEETMNIARFLTSLLEVNKSANKFSSSISEYINMVINHLISYYVDVSNSVVNYLSENIDYHFDVKNDDSFTIRGITIDHDKKKELVKGY